jgi:hypothetical protein
MINDVSVINLLTGNNTLLDSKLIGVSVNHGEATNANVAFRFRARPGSDFSEIRIDFVDVIEYELAYEESERYLDIWDLKFLQLEDNSFYITLDPDPSTLGAAGIVNLRPSDTDHFFVRARHIEAFVTRVDLGEGPT